MPKSMHHQMTSPTHSLTHSSDRSRPRFVARFVILHASPTLDRVTTPLSIIHDTASSIISSSPSLSSLTARHPPLSLVMPDQQLAKQLHDVQQAYDRNDLQTTGKQLTVLKVRWRNVTSVTFADSPHIQIALAKAGLLFPSQDNDKEDLAVARTCNQIILPNGTIG